MFIYIAEGRLGFSTTTLDSTGSLLNTSSTDNVTKHSLLKALEFFKGDIEQTPPLYSALSMDGKRLYDYAREGVPLPRDIPTRKVSIFALDLLSYPSDPFDACLQQFGFSINGQPARTLETHNFSSGFVPKSLKYAGTDPSHVPVPMQGGLRFHIRIHCSSGTYIRTLIADIATRLGTMGHMTDLLRVEQSGFKLGDEAVLEMSDCEDIDKINKALQAGARIWAEKQHDGARATSPSEQ
ncbi:hypothetical protein BG004_003772 [Podila humilis]|nr:hypothetical protein BG004_003772 [Podila humilis]